MEQFGAKARLDGLQAGRAIAALMVVAFHANTFILPDRFYDGAASARAFNMGYAGVEFFFVLSGFIMYYVHARDFSRPERSLAFLRKRILRIYPIYWVIIGTLLVLYFAAPGRGPENARDPVAIVTSVLLWPMPELPIMRVAWTLQHEMLFYLVFTLSILNARIGLLAFGLWMAGCIVAPLAEWVSYPVGFLLSAYNVLFLLGVGAALIFRRIPQPASRLLLVAGMGLFLFTGLSEVYGLVAWDKAWRTWSYGLGATGITAALAAGAVSPPRILTFLGDASYSIYLVHLPAMSILGLVLRKLGAPWALPPTAFLVLMILLSAVVGSLVYAFVERPLLRRLTASIRPLSPTSQGS